MNTTNTEILAEESGEGLPPKKMQWLNQEPGSSPSPRGERTLSKKWVSSLSISRLPLLFIPFASFSLHFLCY